MKLAAHLFYVMVKTFVATQPMCRLQSVNLLQCWWRLCHTVVL